MFCEIGGQTLEDDQLKNPIGRQCCGFTISLPPPLLKEAEKVAKEEYRNMSELFREALRFYIETREVRREAAKDGLFDVIASAQERKPKD